MSRDGRSEYDRLGPLFADCQIVLVEGDIDAQGVKVEVWREAVGGPCLAAQRADIAAVISDDRSSVSVPIWPRSDVARLADEIWELADRDRAWLQGAFV